MLKTISISLRWMILTQPWEGNTAGLVSLTLGEQIGSCWGCNEDIQYPFKSRCSTRQVNTSEGRASFTFVTVCRVLISWWWRVGVRERQIEVGWTVKKTVELVSRTLEKGASVGDTHTPSCHKRKEGNRYRVSGLSRGSRLRRCYNFWVWNNLLPPSEHCLNLAHV